MDQNHYIITLFEDVPSPEMPIRTCFQPKRAISSKITVQLSTRETPQFWNSQQKAFMAILWQVDPLERICVEGAMIQFETRQIRHTR